MLANGAAIAAGKIKYGFALSYIAVVGSAVTERGHPSGITHCGAYAETSTALGNRKPVRALDVAAQLMSIGLPGMQRKALIGDCRIRRAPFPNRQDFEMTYPKYAFSRFASWISELAGKPLAFVAAIIIVAVWAAAGPVLGYSETWQLVINTGTTIVTFLMVFVLQNAQTRDTRAIQAKLDELIRSSSGAENGFIGIESLDETELKKLSALLLKAAHGGGANNDDCQLPQAVRDVLVEVERRDAIGMQTAPEGPAPQPAANI